MHCNFRFFLYTASILRVGRFNAAFQTTQHLPTLRLFFSGSQENWFAALIITCAIKKQQQDKVTIQFTIFSCC